MYVVLAKRDKHLRYMELGGTTERLTLYTNCRRNRGLYNQVQLDLFVRKDT
jgi:hypothetical protein